MLKNMDLILEELQLYIEKHYVEETSVIKDSSEKVDDVDQHDEDAVKAGEEDSNESLDLEDMLEQIGETFHEMLFRKIDERGLSYTDVYKKGGIDRKLFSKIRSNPAYHPSKLVVIELAVALRLTMKETTDLLSRAEYAFSPSNKRDVIVQFFIEKGIYDLDTINYCLYNHDQPLLGTQTSRNTVHLEA